MTLFAHPSMRNRSHAADSARRRWDARVFGSSSQRPVSGTLAELLAQDGSFADHLVAGIGVGIAQYLEVLHHAGHVHGDVRPASILLPGNDTLWLVDPVGDALDRSRADDIAALAITLVECATGLRFDASANWTPELLTQVGCSARLAQAIGSIQPAAGATATAALLKREDQALPRRSSDFA